MIPSIDFVEELARAAGAILLRHFGDLQAVHKKGARDLVTAADRESEALIVARLREEFPGDAILAEETLSSQGKAPRLWVVDPLDGTTNFVHGLPHFGVSIAFWLEGRGEVACVFNPLLDECYTAARDLGAWRGGRPIRGSGQEELAESLLATGFHYRRDELHDSNLEHFTDLAYRARGLRRLGAAALDLCYVAEGRFDGFWELHLAPWDVAAGALVAAEAGVAISDFSGGEDWLFGGQIVAASAPLNRELRILLGAADPARLPGPRWRPPSGEA